MTFWETPIVTAVVGIIVGAAGAYVQIALSARARAGEDLRERRLEVYPVIWQETATISSFPRVQLRWSDLKELHLLCRRWYYTQGGLLLSERSRERYGDLQRLLGARLSVAAQLSDRVPRDAYIDLEKAGSAFRTALAEDLATRRQRSVVWLFRSWRWHRQQHRAVAKSLQAVDGTPPHHIPSYPVDELVLHRRTQPPRRVTCRRRGRDDLAGVESALGSALQSIRILSRWMRPLLVDGGTRFSRRRTALPETAPGRTLTTAHEP